MPRRTSTLFAFAFAMLLASVLPLLLLREQRPSLEVRVQPWQMPAGKLFPGHTLGQSFRCPTDTLRTIEVALVRQPGDSPRGLVLTLRAESAAGEVLRTVTLEPPPNENGPQFFAFEFEPLTDVLGKQLHFELAGAAPDRVSDWSPWISWRGRSGASRAWGDRTVSADEAVLAFRSSGIQLAAVALAVDGLNVPAGECRVEVRRSGDDELLREGTLHHKSPIAAGYAVFSFEPIKESRFVDYELRFVLPQDARVVATAEGLSAISLHGAAPPTEQLLGMTRAGRLLPHRDLIFRLADASSARGQLGLLLERISWPRLFAAWLLSWVASGWVLALFLARFRTAGDY